MSKIGNINRYARIRKDREAAMHEEIFELTSNGALRVHCSDRYLITKEGHVYSTLNRRVRRLSPGVKPGGYEFVAIYPKPKKVIYAMIHRLVAIAFIPNPLALPEVNHLDGNKKNNTISNLEWCDRSVNAIHAYETGLIPSGPGCKSLDEAEIHSIRCSKGAYRDIGGRFGVSAQTVCNIKRGYGHKKREAGVMIYRGES